MVIIMGVCPNCGSWVDEGDVCGCCGGSGSYSYEDDDEISFTEIRSEKSRYSRKAWDLYMDFRDEEALYYIDLALDLDIGDSGNWNRKAIILESLKRYPESLQCYDASLKRRRSATVMDNKARMLYAWACDLLEESKELPDGRYLLHKARKKISQSMDSLSPDTSEDLNKYVRLRDSIDFYIEYENKVYECRAKGILKKNKISPLVSDFAEFEIIDDETGNLVSVVDRKNSLIRPPVANLDAVVIVVAASKPEPSLLFLDTQLVFLENINVTPIICLNKIDLDNEIDIKNIYEKIGYKVILTSVKENEGIDELRETIRGKTVAFVGNSGVGKSSLTNILLNSKVMEEGSLSKIERGKQTTRHSELLKLEEETYIIDTPGFSNFDLPDIDASVLSTLFIEFRDKLNNCKYRDCRHVLEKDCGVRIAVDNNDIAESRFENFKIMYEDLAKRKSY